MFGKNNMQEMMAKLQEMQGAVSESKKRLENIYVKGETEDGNVRFVLDGNRDCVYTTQQGALAIKRWVDTQSGTVYWTTEVH